MQKGRWGSETEGGEEGDRGRWRESDQSFTVQADEGEVGGTKKGNRRGDEGDQEEDGGMMSLMSQSGSGGGGANMRSSGL